MTSRPSPRDRRPRWRRASGAGWLLHGRQHRAQTRRRVGSQARRSFVPSPRVVRRSISPLRPTRCTSLATAFTNLFLWQLRRRLQQKAASFPDTSTHPCRRRPQPARVRRQSHRPLLWLHGSGRLLRSRFSRAHSQANRRAALVLYAANDPFVRITEETRTKIAANQNIHFVETSDGGHCAFVGTRNGSDGRRDDGYWAESEIVNFLRQF